MNPQDLTLLKAASEGPTVLSGRMSKLKSNGDALPVGKPPTKSLLTDTHTGNPNGPRFIPVVLGAELQWAPKQPFFCPWII